jgi:fimbrial isopeptide formation D2 family protein
VTFGVLDSKAQVEELISSTIDTAHFKVYCADANGNVYMAYVDPSGKKLGLSRYNGLIWQDLPALELDTIIRVTDAEIHSGEVYVSGDFWDGKNNQVKYNGMARWGKTGWNTVGANGPFVRNVKHAITDLIKVGKKLYVQGTFDTLNQNPVNGWAVWNDTVWESTAVSLSRNVTGLASINNTDTLIFGTGNNFFFKSYKGAILDSFTAIGFGVYAVGKGVLFGSQRDFKLYQDGIVISIKDTLLDHILVLTSVEYHDGKIWVHGRSTGNPLKLNYVYGTPNNFSEFKSHYSRSILKSAGKELYFLARDRHFGRINRNASIIKGSFWLDLNQNCRKDSVDKILPEYVYAKGQIYGSYVNRHGEYSFAVPPGKKYKITTTLPKYYSLACNNIDTLFAIKDSTYQKDLTGKANSTLKDVKVGVFTAMTRHGDTATRYTIPVENVGTDSMDDVKVVLQLDKRLTNFRSSYSHTVTGNKVEFVVPTLDVFEKVNIPFLVHIHPDTFSLGDTIINWVEVASTDADTFDNKDTSERIVVGAFDPNNKLCFPSGNIYSDLDEIFYTINFQNTGTDTAIRVTVVDTVDTRLPLQYIKVLGTSHPDTYELTVKNNTLIWTFDNIMLPDSNVDVEGSKGYITYKAKITSGFDNVGDSITNRAHIYFDYQDPVATNVAVVIREDSVDNIPDPPTKIGLYIELYPNPADDKITVWNHDKVDHSIKIYDINGRLVVNETNLPQGKSELKTDQLINGLYLVQYEHGLVAKLLVAR